MRYSIWGTGSSARDLLSELGTEGTLVQFVESEPSKGMFMGKSVVGPLEMDLEIDRLYIASQYYPNIISCLEQTGYPLKKVQVVVSHRDDPRFGCIRLDASEVLPRLSDYEKHESIIKSINDELSGLNIPAFGGRLEHLTGAFRAAPKRGLVLEFGVYRGESLLHLARQCDRPVWGFDSFSGFDNAPPWDFDNSTRVHTELPQTLQTYPYLVPGFFKDTFIPFLRNNQGEDVSFVHYDAGHYEAAKYVLEALRPLFSSGSIVVFDEYVPTPTDLEASEYRVYNEVLLNDGWKFFSRCGDSVAVIKVG